MDCNLFYILFFTILWLKSPVKGSFNKVCMYVCMYSIAHGDGTLRKTTKSILLNELETSSTSEPTLRMSDQNGMPTAYVIGRLVVIQSLKSAGAGSVSELE